MTKTSINSIHEGATLRLAEQLISRASVTPMDAGCQELISKHLRPLGFICETIISGPESSPVTNLWAKRPGFGVRTELFVFAGHTDVVPTGPLDQWNTDPFTPTHMDGHLYGRGASDMKTSLAAFVVATQEFLQAQPQSPLSIAFLLTSDEEGPAVDGTVKVCRLLQERGERLDYCIVGEPTSIERSGDMIKNGRRGTMSGKLTIKGIQGHIAYPQLAKNPIHLFAPVLSELVSTEWDQGNDFFPPTSWQVSNIHGGTGVSNVIPGTLVVDFNFRFCTESEPNSLQERVRAILTKHGLDFELSWIIGGLPFLTPPGTLLDTVIESISEESGIKTILSTTGGTSDGRFIAKICPQVIELGPTNATIHKINECLPVADIEPLKNMYRRVLEKLSARLSA